MKRIRPVSRVVAVVAALLLSLTFTACGASVSSPVGDVAVEQPAGGGMREDGGVALPEQGTQDGDSSGAMVIRTKTMRLEVESTRDAVDKVRELTRTYEGTVSNMQIASGDEWVYHYDESGNAMGDGAAVRGWVTVRVPTESYEDFVADIGELGTIRFQSETSDDVTQEHVDMTARLENLRAQEVRLREFFDAAKTVEDMLSIETELNRVRGEIESLDAQVKYLERQAAMSTVSVEFVEPRDIVAPDGSSWGFVDALTDGIQGAARVLTVALTVLIASSPIWLLGLVVFFIVRAVLRRRRAVAATPPMPGEEAAAQGDAAAEPGGVETPPAP